MEEKKEVEAVTDPLSEVNVIVESEIAAEVEQAGDQAEITSNPSAPKPVVNSEKNFSDVFLKISEAVLDAAANANKSAEVGAKYSRLFGDSLSELNEFSQKVKIYVTVMLVVVCALAAGSIVFFSVVGVQMLGRLKEIDTLSLELGKKIIELKVSSEALTSVYEEHKSEQKKINELMAQATEGVATIQKKLNEEKIDKKKETPKDTQALNAYLKNFSNIERQLVSSQKNLAGQVSTYSSRLSAIEARLSQIVKSSLSKDDLNGKYQSISAEISRLRADISNLKQINIEAMAIASQGEKKSTPAAAIRFPKEESR